MPPQKQNPDPWEHEYAIRRLTETMEKAIEQMEVNANNIRALREDLLILKTKWGFLVTMASIAGGVISSILVLVIKGGLHL